VNWQLIERGSVAYRPFAKQIWYVGANAPKGVRTASSLLSLISLMSAGDLAYIGPGIYNETLITIPQALNGCTFVGMGNRGSVKIAPSVAGQGGIVCNADDITFENLDVRATDTAGVAFTLGGARFRGIRCSFSLGSIQVSITPGTVAEQAAGTKGTAEKPYFEDCYIFGGTAGVKLFGTDYGAVVDAKFINCHFGALTASSFTEGDGSGGAAAARFFNLVVDGCRFLGSNAGVAPTKWFDLNGNNANTGIVTNSSFPTAINSGKNLVSTALFWVSNSHTGGVSAAQPS
jgi:hypothetical protein